MAMRFHSKSWIPSLVIALSIVGVSVVFVYMQQVTRLASKAAPLTINQMNLPTATSQEKACQTVSNALTSTAPLTVASGGIALNWGNKKDKWFQDKTNQRYYIYPDLSANSVVTPTPTPSILSTCTGPNGSSCTITIRPPMPVCPPGKMCPQVMPAQQIVKGSCQNGQCVTGGSVVVTPTTITANIQYVVKRWNKGLSQGGREANPSTDTPIAIESKACYDAVSPGFIFPKPVMATVTPPPPKVTTTKVGVVGKSYAIEGAPGYTLKVSATESYNLQLENGIIVSPITPTPVPAVLFGNVVQMVQNTMMRVAQTPTPIPVGKNNLSLDAYVGQTVQVSGYIVAQNGLSLLMVQTISVVPTPTAAASVVCGGKCVTNTDCIRTSGGIQTVCYNGTCQNPQCLGSTTPGTICSCGAAPTGIACGQPCGAQRNGQIYPTNCINGICGNSQNGGDSDNRCLPTSASGYIINGGICKNDPNPAVYCLAKSNGTPLGNTVDVQVACAVVIVPVTVTPPTKSAYTCPVAGYVNCMPSAVGAGNLQTGTQCTPDYQAWAKANCKNFQGFVY